MKFKTYRILLTLLLTALTLAFTACGSLFGAGQEERQLGINGYVYVPEQLSSENNNANASSFWTGNFHVANGYLYYTNNGIICRIPLTDTPDFSSDEQICAVKHMTGFTVDQEQNLYCCASPKYTDAYSTEVPPCITLSKYSPEGVLCYRLELSNERDAALETGMHSPIAVDADGNVLLLTENGILKIDKNGSLSGKYTLADTQVDSNIRKYLLQCSDGQIYYVADNFSNASREVYFVTSEASPEITLITSLSGSFFTDLYEGLDGLLTLTRGAVSIYRFSDGATESKTGSSEQKGNSMTDIFCFEDVDMIASDVEAVVQIDQNRFLAVTSVTDESYHAHQEFYLMTKTSVEELPEKEIIVLASLFPTEDLKRMVIEFNKASDKYHISIESYGAINSWEDNEGAYTRLDSSMVSGNKPDLLDLAYMDAYKYAESGAVADLTPYIEQSSMVRPEQYLENLRAGYTINGKLICLPRKFYIFAVYGYDERSTSAESWTMKDVMAITDKYPDTRLLPGFCNSSSFMLESFCAPYYLETFIDWESGYCSFDCDEFYHLLEWINKQLTFGSGREESILDASYMYGFDDYWREAMEHEADPVLLGFPSADGNKNPQIYTYAALCLVENSPHSEGAWAFLEYYIAHEDTSPYDLGFPSLKEELNALAEDMVTPVYSKDYEGNLLTDMNGNYIQREKWYGYINGEPIPCYVMEQSHVDAVMDMINSMDFTPRSALENSIIEIVTEEADYYFNNNKSAEDVAGIIQNRVQNLIQESR